MNHLYSKLLVIAALLLPLSTLAQSSAARPEKCLAHHMYQEQLAGDANFQINQQNLEIETQQFVNQYIADKQAGNQRNASVVRIIPVVFHIIHIGGPENISRTQCVNQIDSLNMDFRRLNADAAQTPAPFQALGGDAEIEFRLATLDPQGNCTDGVVRVYSELTTDARNNVKALSYWPSNKYLNIWVVKSIENTSGAAGIILGFAQFPGGAASTDGVVMRHDVVGSIGTAANAGFDNTGRTATHEVGHWLNLRHIWGDATCGSDLVSDTPVHNTSNGGCPAQPHYSTCSGAPREMTMNYMDYTYDACMYMFTEQQKIRMQATYAVGGPRASFIN